MAQSAARGRRDAERAAVPILTSTCLINVERDQLARLAPTETGVAPPRHPRMEGHSPGRTLIRSHRSAPPERAGPHPRHHEARKHPASRLPVGRLSPLTSSHCITAAAERGLRVHTCVQSGDWALGQSPYPIGARGMASPSCPQAGAPKVHVATPCCQGCIPTKGNLRWRP